MKPPRKLEPNKRVHVHVRAMEAIGEASLKLKQKTAPKAVYFRGARIK